MCYSEIPSTQHRNTMQTKKFQGVQTRVIPMGEGVTVGRYRDTDVCTLLPDGSVVLNSDGSQTYTTKARMNQFAEEFCGGRFRVYQKGGKWLVSVVFGGPDAPYADGMTIPNYGTLDTGRIK